MPKNAKSTPIAIAAALLLALALPGTAAQSASAETPSLSYLEFQATPEYAQLMAANAVNADVVSHLTGMELTTDFTTSVSQVKLISIRAITSTNRTNSWAQVYKLDDLGNVTQVNANYYYGWGKYIQELDDFQTGDSKIANIQNVLTRLKKPEANSVSSNVSAAPQVIDDIKPSNLFKSAATDTLTSKSFNGEGMTFSHIAVSVDPNYPQSTTFSFQSTQSVGSAGNHLNISYSETFDYFGLLTVTSLNESDDQHNFGLSFLAKLTAHNDLQVFVPQPFVTVDKQQLINMAHRIAAEKLATPKAKSIAAVAKSLAKSSKSSLTSKLLLSAAKTLAIKVTSINNGVKVTAKSSGIAGNMCVTVSKAKTAINHC